MLGTAWTMVKDTISGYWADNSLSRGAAIAYYTILSIGPVVVICIAIAGLAFGDEAARGAVAEQLKGLMGQQGADAVQSMVASASNKSSGIIATVVGIGTLLLTASGVFGEMQSSLNAIWRVQAPSGVSGIVKTRAASLGLVAALGFLLLVSLVASAAISALGTYMSSFISGMELLLQVVNFAVSFALVSLLFAAIYKILPDKALSYGDVLVGAVATAFLFTVGKTLIGLYIGSSQVASSYGAAGAFVIVLLWIYYSSQIFLLGAEFTKVWSARHGTVAVEGGLDNAPAPMAPGGGAGAHVEIARRAAQRSNTRWIDVVAVAGVLFAVFRSQRR